MRVRWMRVFFFLVLISVLIAARPSARWLRDRFEEPDTLPEVYDALMEDYTELLDTLDRYENPPVVEPPGFWDRYGGAAQVILVLALLTFMIAFCPFAVWLLAIAVRRFTRG